MNKFYDIGFHGDLYLIEIVAKALGQSRTFIETGSNTGSTLSYTAKNYPAIQCYSCEPRTEAYENAKKNTKGQLNVKLMNQSSPEFLYEMLEQQPELAQSSCVFWLDAHGMGFQWPLKEEISFITKRFSDFWIFIDDFQVPEQNQFGYDSYNGQICNFDYIKEELEANIAYTIVYPSYKDKTSLHHPLRGWVLITNNESGSLELDPNFYTKIA